MYLINASYEELYVLRDMLMHKYGREFSVAVMENRDDCVSERVSSDKLYRPRGLTPRLVLSDHAEIGYHHSARFVGGRIPHGDCEGIWCRLVAAWGTKT